MTDTIERACPRCKSANLCLTMQTLTSFTFVEVGQPGMDVDVDSDGFISLACLNCDLLLVQEPGDGRLRRAAMDEDSPPQYEDAMIALAEALLGISQDTVGLPSPGA